MSENPENRDLYRNREQSLIKHLFLEKYLETAAIILLQSYSGVFNYVDAFAGPWSNNDDDYADTSFGRAIDVLEGVRVFLARQNRPGLKIRFCLCERSKPAFERLSRYAAEQRRFEIYVFPGRFEDNLDAISSKIQGGFTFTFIDPTGWNVKNEAVFRFLRSRKGEFLFNFMSDHINRHAQFSPVSASFGHFLDDADWSGRFALLPGEWSNEQRILHLLKERFRAASVAAYLADFAILSPRKNRVKMRLILGTNSLRGLEVFRDVQQKVELEQFGVRNALREELSPQASLLTGDDIADLEQQNDGLGSRAHQIASEALMLRLLISEGPTAYAKLLAEVLQAHSMRRPDVNKLVGDLRKRGLVGFDLASPRHKVPQDDTMIGLVAQNDTTSKSN